MHPVTLKVPWTPTLSAYRWLNSPIFPSKLNSPTSYILVITSFLHKVAPENARSQWAEQNFRRGFWILRSFLENQIRLSYGRRDFVSCLKPAPNHAAWTILAHSHVRALPILFIHASLTLPFQHLGQEGFQDKVCLWNPLKRFFKSSQSCSWETGAPPALLSSVSPKVTHWYFLEDVPWKMLGRCPNEVGSSRREDRYGWFDFQVTLTLESSKFLDFEHFILYTRTLLE